MTSVAPEPPAGGQVKPPVIPELAPGELLEFTWTQHQHVFSQAIRKLKNNNTYTDATLACDGQFYPVHKFVLSTCSEFFSAMFEWTPCVNPVLVLNNINTAHLESILNFMYMGEASVKEQDLTGVLRAAQQLRVTGLCTFDDNTRPVMHKDTTAHSQHMPSNVSRPTFMSQQIKKSPDSRQSGLGAAEPPSKRHKPDIADPTLPQLPRPRPPVSLPSITSLAPMTPDVKPNISPVRQPQMQHQPMAPPMTQPTRPHLPSSLHDEQQPQMPHRAGNTAYVAHPQGVSVAPNMAQTSPHMSPSHMPQCVVPPQQQQASLSHPSSPHQTPPHISPSRPPSMSPISAVTNHPRDPNHVYQTAPSAVARDTNYTMPATNREGTFAVPPYVGGSNRHLQQLLSTPRSTLLPSPGQPLQLPGYASAHPQNVSPQQFAPGANIDPQHYEEMRKKHALFRRKQHLQMEQQHLQQQLHKHQPPPFRSQELLTASTSSSADNIHQQPMYQQQQYQQQYHHHQQQPQQQQHQMMQQQEVNKMYPQNNNNNNTNNNNNKGIIFQQLVLKPNTVPGNEQLNNSTSKASTVAYSAGNNMPPEVISQDAIKKEMTATSSTASPTCSAPTTSAATHSNKSQVSSATTSAGLTSAASTSSAGPVLDSLTPMEQAIINQIRAEEPDAGDKVDAETHDDMMDVLVNEGSLYCFGDDPTSSGQDVGATVDGNKEGTAKETSSVKQNEDEATKKTTEVDIKPEPVEDSHESSSCDAPPSSEQEPSNTIIPATISDEFNDTEDNQGSEGGARRTSRNRSSGRVGVSTVTKRRRKKDASPVAEPTVGAVKVNEHLLGADGGIEITGGEPLMDESMAAGSSAGPSYVEGFNDGDMNEQSMSPQPAGEDYNNLSATSESSSGFKYPTRFKCPQCPKICMKAETLSKHLESHRDKNKQHGCTSCTYIGSSLDDLREHRKTHMSKKCDFCDFTTNRTDALKRHLMHHEPGSQKTQPGEKLFFCNACNFSCTSSAVLKHHSKNHHNLK